MHQILLTDQVYYRAKRRAAAAGFDSVDDYVVNILADDEDSESFEHLFTPERIAHLDRISADVKAGAATYTSEEVQEHFRKKSEAWPERLAS